MTSVEQQQAANYGNANGNSEKICVAIRMRPLNEREKNSGQEACFRVHSDQNSIVQLRGKYIHYVTFMFVFLVPSELDC